MDNAATLSAHFTEFKLNGRMVKVSAAAGVRLSHSLREQLGAKDVKIGCNAGDCGACTVLVDGDPVCACLMPTQQAAGKTLETLVGLVGQDPRAKALVQSFQNHQAAQCGICTPGVMVSAVALLRDVPKPTIKQVQDALGGVLCRCTGYRKIIDAVCEAGQAEVFPVAVSGSGAVGTSVARLDGLQKLQGREVFGDDVAPPQALVIKAVRSPFARAEFRFGDLENYVTSTAGVHAVLTAADVPGKNAFGVIPAFQDQPVFAETEARFRGEAVAAVIGTAAAMACFDEAGFPVIWEERPAVSRVAQALMASAPQLHADHPQNVMCGGFVARGDAQNGLLDADAVVEGLFETGFVEHGYIEPEAGFAECVEGRIEVHACTQAPVMDLESLAAILGCDQGKLRIRPTAVGGGFGSKLDLSVQPFLALATLKTGQPVRMTYSRTETMQATTKRHPSEIDLKIGATKAGRICGFVFTGDFNTGAYASWGPTVANRVPVHASGPYQIADYRAESRGIYTHCPPAGAFRGFGVPQAAIAQESLFDELADKLGIDALEFREINALEDGAETVCGQVFTQGVGIKDCLRALRPAWQREKALCAAFNAENASIKRGVGVAAGWYGCGNTSLPNPSTIKSGITAEGRIFLHQGATDIGQGSNTVIAQIFAQALGVVVLDIHLLGPDTDITPDAGKTSASRQTFVSGNAARLSGESLRRKVLALANAGPDASFSFDSGTVTICDGAGPHVVALQRLPVGADGYVLEAIETYDPPTLPLDENGQGVPYAQFGYAAHLAVVEVDIRLGSVIPQRFTAAHDVGQAINPLLVEGQVQGGIAQGLGMALMEEYLPGRTENLHDYLMPTIGDVPPIETLIIEQADAEGPYGAKGLGEHVLIPTAPALLNAIKNATGVRLYSVPATPSRVRTALKEAGYD